ncbi:alpha/beta hydrolase [Actinomadura sp. WMMA1423]|uniref:alpha/beta hydrolase n=1 Tax=Actinomadura sp. WMMA1423 TaxID=2591108 RepID=UPI0011465BC2|nr:alpha/beta hydrolase [Actinomadura sp. WMMA1423]
MTTTRIVVVVAAVVCAVVGGTGLLAADHQLQRRGSVVEGVPVEIVRATGADGRVPGVVVAHGFGGSGRLMRGFADTLARRGYAVALVDLAGHGASSRRLPGSGDGPAAEARLDHDLDVAVRRLRGMPRVDGGRIGLVGHSLGAAAVIRYGAAHPSIGATVAISQGEMAVPASARNVLLVAGGLEFAPYRDGAVRAVRDVHPEGRPGATYGDPRDGTARRAVIVGGVEHVGVLFSPRTHHETGAWLDAAFGRRSAPVADVRAVQGAGSAVLLHLAAVLSFGAIAAALLGRPPDRRAARRPVSVRFALAAAVLAVGAAVPAMGVFRSPVAVAGPLAGFFGVAGVVALVCARDVAFLGGRPSARTMAATAVLAVSTVVSFAVPAQLGWAYAVPVGPRVWALVPIAVGTGLYCLGVEALCAGHERLTAIGVHAWTATAALAALCAAALVGAVSPFVLLVSPLVAGLLVWQGVQAAALRAVRAPAWVTAVVGGVLLSWPLAVTMPIT